MQQFKQVGLRRNDLKGLAGLRRLAAHLGGAASRLLLLIAATMTLVSAATAKAPIKVVAFGDSLTAGYGLPPGKDFASRLEAALKKNGHDVEVLNAGVSGDTTSGGLARFDWAVPDDADAVILELGANDALRAVPPKTTRANLDAIMARLAGRNIPVLIAGMRGLANWGADYVTAFEAIFPDLAEKYKAVLYPFFLDGVIDNRGLKLPDALHPNEKGVDEIVRRILPSVETLLQRARR